MRGDGSTCTDPPRTIHRVYLRELPRYLYDIAVGKYESTVDCLRGRSETCINTLSTSTSVENNNPCFASISLPHAAASRDESTKSMDHDEFATFISSSGVKVWFAMQSVISNIQSRIGKGFVMYL